MLADEIRQQHGDHSAFIFRTNLADRKTCEPLINDVSEKFGRLDMLVNNASLFGKTEIEKLTADDMDRYYHMHVTAPMILSATAAELLRKSGHGRIINIVDIFAKYPRVGFTPYTVSKAALVSLTKQLAVELAPDITVNSIAPGAILEPVEGMSEKEKEEIVSRIPLARFGSTVDIASAVLFLANADYITGQTIIIDGGRTLNI